MSPEASDALKTEALPAIPGYEVLEVVNQGGMGIICKARHTRLDRLVALKVIRPERLGHPDAVGRFLAEAKAAARLCHPHIVSLYDAGQVGELHFLVMEYVDGIDLARLVAERGPLPVDQAACFIRQAALGLQHAFERGLVHRDIKPANLMVTLFSRDPQGSAPSGEGVIKILDLGLARLGETSGDSSPGLTKDGGLIGTPDYIAPEQIDDPHRADIRSDLYSLGCTFYFLLTGQVPFPGGSMIQKLDQHRWSQPQAIESLRSDVLPEVSSVVNKLLAKRPEERYQTPAEVVAALSHFQFVENLSPPAEKASETLHESPTIAKVEQTRPSQNCRRFAGHGDWVTGLAFAPFDQQLVSASRDGSLCLWDLATGKELRLWEGHPGGALCVAFSPAGQRIISGGRDRVIRVWDVATGSQVQCLEGHAGDVECLAVSSDGSRLLSGSQDRSVRFWNLQTGKEQRRIGGTVAERHWDAVQSVTFSPDGRQALSGSQDRTAILWDLETGRELRALRGHEAAVHAVAFSPDGRLALTAGGKWLQLWDIHSGKQVGSLEGHNLLIRSAAFSPDGRLAASGSEDRAVRTWEIDSGKEVRCLEGHRSWVLCVAFSPDGQSIASGSADRSICVWPYPSPS